MSLAFEVILGPSSLTVVLKPAMASFTFEVISPAPLV